jgi:hypothetical protein
MPPRINVLEAQVDNDSSGRNRPAFRVSQAYKRPMREGRLQTVFNWTSDVAGHDWGNEQPQITVVPMTPAALGAAYMCGVDGVEKALRVGDHATNETIPYVIRGHVSLNSEYQPRSIVLDWNSATNMSELKKSSDNHGFSG